MKTFENYGIHNDILIEQSCDDGSIVKVEVHNRTTDEWIDATVILKDNAQVGMLAAAFYTQYRLDKNLESTRTPLRDMMPDILGIGPKDVA